MANDIKYDRILLSIATGQICQSLGWHGIHKTPHNILTDVLERYINDLARTVIGCSLNGSRTSPNIEDVNLAFDQLGVELHELEDYITQVEPSPLHRAVSKIPANIDVSTSLLKFPTAEEVAERAEYIDEHLPPLVSVMVEKEEEEEVKEEEAQPVVEGEIKEEPTEETNAAPRRPKDLVLSARRESTESPPYSPIEPKSLNLDAQENVDLTRPGLKVTTPKGFTPTLTTQPPLMGVASITNPLANITNKKNSTVISPAQLIASVPKTEESLTVIKKPTNLTTKSPIVQRNPNLVTPSSVVKAASPKLKASAPQKFPMLDKSPDKSTSSTSSAKKEPDKIPVQKLPKSPKSPSVKKIIKAESIKVELESPKQPSPKTLHFTIPEKTTEKVVEKDIEKEKKKEPPASKLNDTVDKSPPKPVETRPPPKTSKKDKSEEKNISLPCVEKPSTLTISPLELKKEPVEIKPVSVVVNKIPETVITSPVKPLKIELPSPPVSSKKPALTLASLIKTPITPSTPKQTPSTPKLTPTSKSIPTTPLTPKTPSYLKGGLKSLAGLRKIASEPIVSPFDDEDDYGLGEKREVYSPPPLTRSPMFTSPPAIPVERQASVKIEPEPCRSPSRSVTPPSPIPSPKPSLVDSDVKSDIDIEETSDHDNTVESSMNITVPKVSFTYPSHEDTHKKKKKKKDKDRDKSKKSDGSSKEKKDKKRRKEESLPVPIPKITLKMGGETISDSSAKFVFKSVPSPSPSPSPVSPVTPSLPSPNLAPPLPAAKPSAKKTKQSKAKEAKETKKVEATKEAKSSSGFYVETLENTSSALGGEVYYCPACGLPDDGSPMIGCDACDLWYHWPCVNITVEPAEDEKWYCPNCPDGLPKRKKKKKKH